MKNIIGIFIFCTILFSCKNNENDNRFSVTGELKNAGDQKIYLEELFFNGKDPEVIDTAEIIKGKFIIKGNATEEGLYRLRLEKDKAGFIFINDSSHISFAADLNQLEFKNILFNSAANQRLKEFVITTNEQINILREKADLIKQSESTQNSDSLLAVLKKEFDEKSINHKKFILNYIDTCSNATLTLFALGYTREIEPEKLNKTVKGLTKRFPANETVAGIVAQFNVMMEKANKSSVPQEPGLSIGSIAPELNMPDVNGNMFALSQLKGKYVLIDFWASWCGPCRAENPNLVSAYNTFKNKNFTILGVSLDKEKQAWLNAIKDDHLGWQQISDLKYWNSAATSLYGFDGIPYNVLIDPTGKILATQLRGSDLQNKLAEVLK